MTVKPSSHRRAVAEVQRDACRPIMHGKPATDADSEGSSAPKLNLNGSQYFLGTQRHRVCCMGLSTKKKSHPLTVMICCADAGMLKKV